MSESLKHKTDITTRKQTKKRKTEDPGHKNSNPGGRVVMVDPNLVPLVYLQEDEIRTQTQQRDNVGRIQKTAICSPRRMA